MNIHQRLEANIELLMRRKSVPDFATLAKIAKVAPNTIHSAAKGRYSTSLRSLDKIAHALGVEAWQLLAPTAMIDDAMAPAAGQIIDAYRRASADGRDIILKVAEAQASYSGSAPTRPGDQSEG